MFDRGSSARAREALAEFEALLNNAVNAYVDAPGTVDPANFLASYFASVADQSADHPMARYDHRHWIPASAQRLDDMEAAGQPPYRPCPAVRGTERPERPTHANAAPVPAAVHDQHAAARKAATSLLDQLLSPQHSARGASSAPEAIPRSPAAVRVPRAAPCARRVSPPAASASDSKVVFL